MSELKDVVKLAENELGEVAGGMTRNYLAALDVMAGKYGTGEERKQRLQAAGYDYWAVQHLVNGLAYGYDQVARDVIAGKYGNNQDRINALSARGYDAGLVQGRNQNPLCGGGGRHAHRDCAEKQRLLARPDALEQYPGCQSHQSWPAADPEVLIFSFRVKDRSSQPESSRLAASLFCFGFLSADYSCSSSSRASDAAEPLPSVRCGPGKCGLSLGRREGAGILKPNT